MSSHSVPMGVAHTGVARLGARVRPGWFAQTHEHPELLGRTLLEILHRGGDGHQQIGGTGPCSDGERHGDGGLLSRDGHIADHADHTKP